MAQTHFYTCDVCGSTGIPSQDRFFLERTYPEGWRHVSIEVPAGPESKSLFRVKWKSADCCSDKCLRSWLTEYIATPEEVAS